MADSKSSNRPHNGGGHGPGGGMGMPTGKAKNFKAAWGKLLKFCKPYYFPVIISFIFAIAATVLQVIAPGIVGRIAVNITNMSKVEEICATLVIMYAIMFVLFYVQGFIMATVTQRIAKRLRKKQSEKINNLPLSYYDRTSFGDVLSRITNDTDTVSSSLNQSVVSLISSIALLGGAVIAMFLNCWILAIIAIVSSLGGFLAMGKIIKMSQKHFIAQQKSLGAINGHIEEYYSGHSVVKVSNAGVQVSKTFNKLNGDLFESAWKSQFFSGLMMPLMNFISNFSYLCVCVVGGVLVWQGDIDIGVVVSFMIYVRIFTQPMGQLAQSLTGMQSAAAASERVFEFLDEPEMEDESGLAKHLDTIKGAVSFNNVKFGYVPEKIIIKGFSADIKAGSKVAIVGPTGAGKTTIVNLLMKFYKVGGGEILIDGVPIGDLRRDNVHQLFGMVLQDTWLFEGTVRENLVYNMKGVTDEQLDRACAAVGIDHFIRTLPKGYDTVLNEQASISNGQRQLLTIARAMIKDAPLLILDEATSSVDTRTEVLIQEAMDKLTKGRTSFVIAHRLSTIKNADMILVLKDGDIIENGTHNALVGKKGFYADLYNSQFSLEGSEVTV